MSPSRKSGNEAITQKCMAGGQSVNEQRKMPQLETVKRSGRTGTTCVRSLIAKQKSQGMLITVRLLSSGSPRGRVEFTGLPATIWTPFQSTFCVCVSDPYDAVLVVFVLVDGKYAKCIVRSPQSLQDMGIRYGGSTVFSVLLRSCDAPSLCLRCRTNASSGLLCKGSGCCESVRLKCGKVCCAISKMH